MDSPEQRIKFEAGQKSMHDLIIYPDQVESIIKKHPEVDPSQPLVIDVEEIDIILPSRAFELIEQWPHASFENANTDVEQCLELAREEQRQRSI